MMKKQMVLCAVVVFVLGFGRGVEAQPRASSSKLNRMQGKSPKQVAVHLALARLNSERFGAAFKSENFKPVAQKDLHVELVDATKPDSRTYTVSTTTPVTGNRIRIGSRVVGSGYSTVTATLAVKLLRKSGIWKPPLAKSRIAFAVKENGPPVLDFKPNPHGLVGSDGMGVSPVSNFGRVDDPGLRTVTRQDWQKERVE